MTDTSSDSSGSSSYRPEEEVDITRLFTTLLAGKWWIAAFGVIALLAAAFYLWVTPKIYSADALLQIQARNSAPLVSSSAASTGSGLGAAGALLGLEKSAAQSEIPIITSRSVLGQAVRDLNLTTRVQPKYFPLIGQALATGEIESAAKQGQSAPGLMAASAQARPGLFVGFAWSPTELQIGRFDVPDDIGSGAFKLLALGGGQYKLFGPGGENILSGQVGEAATGRTANGEPIEIFVRSMQISDAPTVFSVSEASVLSTVQSLQNGLVIKEEGSGSGVLSMSLQGEDRERITRTVNAVAQSYVQQNVEAQSKQAEQSLEFLEGQLPELKADVTSAEAKLAEYQEANQPVDLTAESQALLQQTSSLEDKRSQLQMKIAELQETYTSEYPALQAARRQVRELQQQSGQLEEKIGGLPSDQKAMLSLRRDLEVNTSLYTALLNRAQELRVIKAGNIGNVRIVDSAVEPIRAVSPQPMLVRFVFVVFGLGVGVALVLLRAFFRRGLSNPEEIEAQTGYDVYSVIPFSTILAKAARRATRAGKPAPILARDHADNQVTEALRSLRTSLYFKQMSSSSKVLIMTGPSPGVGKSFLSMNLGYLLTQADKKVVVVDADMRRGLLHEFLADSDRSSGLADVLSGNSAGTQVIQRVPDTHLDVVTSGTLPTNPSELLMRAGFSEFIDELKSIYDLVIIDVPPVLAVTDATIAAAAVDNPMTLMVLRSDAHPSAEVRQAIKALTREGIELDGLILNAYRAHESESSYGGQYYQYAYDRKP